MDYLEKINTHQRDKQIIFDEEKHIYTIINDPNIFYTSVTTFINSFFPKFDTDKVIDKMMASSKWYSSKYYGLTKDEIKNLWEKNRNDAVERGTLLHKKIEMYYNDMEVEVLYDSQDFEYFLNFDEKYGKELELYRTEWRIFNEKLKIAGSVDMIYKKPDGSFVICDWKRSKEIKKNNLWQKVQTKCLNHIPDANFWKYALQLNCYREILERNYDIIVSEMCIICFHPNHDNYQKFEIPFMRKEMNELFTLKSNSI